MKSKVFSLILTAVLLPGFNAFAYQLKKTDSGAFVRWNHANVAFKIHRSVGSLENGKERIKVIRRGFLTWQKALNHRVKFNFSGETSSAILGYDSEHPEKNENMIIWQNSEWNHHPDTMAITLVSYKRDSGAIIDADITFNGVHYNWYVQKEQVKSHPDAGQKGRKSPTAGQKGEKPWIEVENTAAHEIGHFLGLSHSSNPEATMFHAQGEKELKKRELHSDDIEGIEFLYGNEKNGGGASEISQNNASLPLSPQANMGCSMLSNRGSQFPSSGWMIGILFLLFTSFKRRSRNVGSSLLVVGCLIGGWVGLEESAHATSVVRMSLKTMNLRANRVIVGEVLKQSCAWNGSIIYTISTVRVEQCIKKKCSKTNVYVQQMGGKIGNIGMFVHGSQLLKPASKVLLFLYSQHAKVVTKGKNFGLHRIVGMSQGLFLFKSKNGELMLQHQALLPTSKKVNKVAFYHSHRDEHHMEETRASTLILQIKKLTLEQSKMNKKYLEQSYKKKRKE